MWYYFRFKFRQTGSQLLKNQRKPFYKSFWENLFTSSCKWCTNVCICSVTVFAWVMNCRISFVADCWITEVLFLGWTTVKSNEGIATCKFFHWSSRFCWIAFLWSYSHSSIYLVSSSRFGLDYSFVLSPQSLKMTSNPDCAWFWHAHFFGGGV